MKKNSGRIDPQTVFISLMAGVLLTLSFPPFDLSVLQIPAFVLLFRLIADTASWREAALRVLPAFLTWNLAATYWLMMATFAGGAAAIVANSILMLLPLEIIRRLMQRPLHPLLLALLSGAVWGCFEFAHHSWELAWPWLTLANGWSNLTGLIQYISLTGHLAISFWVISSSILAWKTVESLRRDHFIYTLGFIMLFPGLSLLVHTNWEEEPSGELEVTVVQPNLDSYQPLGGLESIDAVLDNLLELSYSARPSRTGLIVWPENAIESAIGRENRLNSRLQDSLRNWQSELITGAGFVEYYEPDEAPAIARQTPDNRIYNVFNAGLYFTPEQPLDVYKKSRLVPIVERIPYAELLRKFDFLGLIDWDRVTGYGKGTEANNFPAGGFATPALICYDSVFSHWVGEFVRNGAGFLTIITNDGWWGNTSGHAQHFAYARLRAIEYRHWIVRSANNGISGIISPEGDVLVKTDYWTRTAFSHTIRPTDRLTPYARFGNWFNWLMTAATGIALLLAARRNPTQIH